MRKRELPVVSVVVATKDRQDPLRTCLSSLCRQETDIPYEIIIVDASQTPFYTVPKDPRIRYIHAPQSKGKAESLNIAISNAQGRIIAYTDDDCIPTASWVGSVVDFFSFHSSSVMVFGKTSAYQVKKYPGYVTPCVTTGTKTSHCDAFCIHYQCLGYGNNMAILREVHDVLGGFDPLLGPGSIGSNAEDADFVLRVLSFGGRVSYYPRMRVSHNRHIRGEERDAATVSYLTGELACYGYYAILGERVAKRLVWSHMRDLVQEIQAAWHQGRRIKNSVWYFRLVAARMQGLFVSVLRYFLYRHNSKRLMIVGKKEDCLALSNNPS